jgi:heme exporter protein B
MPDSAVDTLRDAPIRAPSNPSGPIGFWAATQGVLYKDILLEWRSRARFNATVFFALLTLLLFSFAVGPNHAMLERHAPGYLWLGILLASVLSLSESMRVEKENEALEGLRLLPVDSRSIFLGKTIINTLLLSFIGMLLIPIMVAVYGVELKLGFTPLITTIVLGCAAISAPGTLYAAIASQARARDVLLPLLLFPVLIPGMLASVKATTLIMQGDPMGQLANWRSLLTAFSVIYWVLGAFLFGRVIEE